MSAERPLLQTDRAEVRSELKARELVNLPVSINRNYQYLFRVLPGFTPPAEAHSVPSNPSRALVFNVNGASRSSNNIRIDGVSTTNIWLPHVAAYVPALESLETVNVVTSSFDAEQGLAGGSAINVQIKSGTNKLHGSALRVPHQREAADAELLRARQARPRASGSYNQYGGTLGGPIVRNRLFFFGSYEGTRDQQTLNRTLSVPTAALRRGDFCVRAHARSTTRSPATANGSGRTPFAGQHHPGATASTPRRAACSRSCRCRTCPTTDAETNNYFVAGAVRAEPLDARHQVELERQRED